MGKNIFLVSCVKTKSGYPSPAKDLYLSDWFKKASRYASQNADEWFILSAKYFLVLPDHVIEPYDLTLKSMSAKEKKEWATHVYQMLKPFISTEDKIFFLAGQDYRNYLIPLLQHDGFAVNIPMEGLRIGEQKSWLRSKLVGK
jgi:cytoplasmic iron level regulating protein YaaA (DUF328/UPF0246 family)